MRTIMKFRLALTWLTLVAVMVIAGGTVGADQNGHPIASPFDTNLMSKDVTKGASLLGVRLTAVGDVVDMDAALAAGADYLKHAQADKTEDNAGNGDPDSPDDPDDGGWDWLLTSPAFTHSTGASPKNIYGATAQGLYYAYLETSASSYMTAMQDAANVMAGDPDIRSAADLIFLMRFQDLAGVTPDTYKNAAKAKFDGRIAQYGSATALAQHIRDVRASQGYENGIIPWDIGAWAVAAQMLEDRYPTDPYDYATAADDIAEVIYQDSFNDTPGYFDLTSNKNNGWDPSYGNQDYWWYSLGITGLLDAFKAADVHTSEIPGLVTLLLGCQYNGGAFSYCYGANPDDEDWQSTAYAVMSLARVDQTTYQTKINHAAYWLGATQDAASGGWVYSGGNHYPEVGGECTAALYFGENADEVWVDADYCDTCANDGHLWGYDAFDNIQDGVDAVAGSTVHVADGTYTASSLASIVIAKDNLQLIGQSRDGTVIDAGSWGNSSAGWPKGIHVKANNVAIKNFTVQGFTGDGTTTGGYGIVFRDWDHDYPPETLIYYSGGTAENVKLQNNYSALYALLQQNLTVRNSLIQNNSADGMFIARWSHNATIMGNTVLNSGNHGIWVGYDWNAYGPSNNATIIGNTVNGAVEGGISFVASNAAAISDNDVSNAKGGGWSVGAISLKDGVSNVTVSNNIVHDNSGASCPSDYTPCSGRGIGLDGASSNVTLTNNQVYNNAGGGIKVMGTTASGFGAHYNKIYSNTGYGAENTVGTSLNFEYNWWGCSEGPGHTGCDAVSSNVDYDPWLTKPTYQATASMTTEEIQAIIDNAVSGDTIVLEAGTYTPVGGFTINSPGITIMLEDGTVIQATSPCFTVTANDTTITSATFPGGVCEPSGGSDGILTGAAVNNLVIRGVEIRNGTGTGDGIHIGHNVTNLQILDNYIHNMGGDGLEYASGVTVGGVHEVQGNLFQNNTGDGINNQTGSSFNIEYNSWGDIDGPPTGTGGDGVTGIAAGDYTPWTHVALSMTSSGSPVADKVGEGYQITYTIKMDAQEVYGADFDLNFSYTNLEVKSIITNTNFQQAVTCTVSTPAQANASGVIAFCGYRTSALNGTAQNVFTVTFQGVAAGVVPLNLDETDDKFAMAPPGGASNNIYASALTDGSVTVYDSTTVTGRIDLQGRANDAGAVMTFAQGSGAGGPHYGPFTFSTSTYWGGISASNVVYTDTYDITVSMARYLDVTATITSTKSVTITTDNQVLATLVLLGGDANDSNEIEISDATIIGGQYSNSGAGITIPGADINNDNVVDILDLVLMGGNYGKESGTAYASWTP